MELRTRKVLDRSFSVIGLIAILLMAASLVTMLAPIFSRGIGAFIFYSTVEHRKLMLDKFDRGDRSKIEAEAAEVSLNREPLYKMIEDFKNEQEENRYEY
ncbi:MAG: DUF3333 domain-containing protein, partial [Candidatus Krumholzibacteria bacterium]|nr:DUF3333 domain-containing protein [Candidatus Krumholzibacteria bacterium]